MEKVPEKVGPPPNHDKEFWDILNNCVWGSETREEFEMRWNAIIDAYGLQSNEWLVIDIISVSYGFQRSSWIYLLQVSLELLQGPKAQIHSSIDLSIENYVLLSFGFDLIRPWNANNMRS
jgi:hypothetical protein